MGSAAGEYLRARDALLRVREYPEGASLACGLADALGDLKAFGSMIALTREAEQLVEFKAHEFQERLHPRDRHGRWARKPGYRIRHRPEGPGDDTGGPMTDMNSVAPDFYEHPEYYRTGDAGMDAESLAQIMSVRGKPDAIVTAYRSAPAPEFNNGDWVSLSHAYAARSGFDATDPEKDVPVHALRVRAGDLWWPGDSINEFGYWGPSVRLEGKAHEFTERLHPRDWHGRFRKVGDVGKAITDTMFQWRERKIASGRWGQDEPPSYERIVKNWTKAVRRHLSKDRRAIGLVAAAQAENRDNRRYQALIAGLPPDHVIVTQNPEGPHTNTMLDTSGEAAKRMADTTVVPAQNVHEVEKDIADHGRKTPADHPAATSGYGLAAVLRHEYGHSIDDALALDTRRHILDAIPDPSTDLTYYAGFRGDQEVIPELLATVTEPGYRPEDFPPTVREAERRLREAIDQLGTGTTGEKPAAPDKPAWQWTDAEQERVYGFHFRSYGDAVPGGYNGGYIAIDKNGNQLGRLEYQSGGGEADVAWVEVPAEHQRQGVATKLYDWAQRNMPDQKWSLGFTTDEGSQWARSLAGHDHARDRLPGQTTGAPRERWSATLDGQHYDFRPADEGWFQYDEPATFIPRRTAAGQDTLATKQGQGDGIVAYADGKPVASLTWQLEQGRVTIGSTYTVPEHRRRGVFAEMLAELRRRHPDVPLDAYVWENRWLRDLVLKGNKALDGERKAYLERLHPRDRHGRWAHKPGGGLIGGRDTPATLYHVAPTRSRRKIERGGLDPTHKQSTPNAHASGVYLWGSREAAWRYRTTGPNMYADLDIHKVDVHDLKLKRDTWLEDQHPDRVAEFPGGAYYSEQPIPADRVSGSALNPWYDEQHPHPHWDALPGAAGDPLSHDVNLRLLSNATAQREGTTPDLASNQTGIAKNEAEKGLIELEKAGLLRRETREFTMGGKHTYDVYVPTDAAKGKAIDHTRREPYDLPQSFKDEGYADGEQLTFPTGAQVGVASDKDGALKVFDLTYFDPETDGPEDVVKDPEEWLYEIDPTDYLTEQDFSKDFWAGVPDRGETYYHGTTADNLSGIQDTGLEPRSETRGMANRSTPPAVFLHPDETYASEYYGSGGRLGEKGATVAVDLSAMKRDGLTPQVGNEEPLSEAAQRDSVAWDIGLEDFHDESADYDGEDESTLIVYDGIPAKYIKVVEGA